VTYQRPSSSWRSPAATDRAYRVFNSRRPRIALEESFPQVARANFAFNQRTLERLFIVASPKASIVIHRMTFTSADVKAILWTNKCRTSVKILRMSKDTRLTFRVHSDLKKKLEAIAARERRSVAQICETFLKAGSSAYQKKGAKYLQRFLSREKKEEPAG
jgi:predicted transcriptional regulator